ncbi:hypothetical protein SASPL_133735 [Salvia splendens]|uniref:Thioester reductase (TE) domain-containing protein n=1 Tax=Salvia splendens TaxID=180675 RepID=A0A8X8ZID9_SALSN|nr:hypothetical protein SASPL_133735 [Salvia splendens]
MLMSAATGFCSPIKSSIYLTKFGANHPKLNAFSGKYQQTHSYSTKFCHPPASQLTAAAAAVVDNNGHGGIGILDFYKGKNIFVIGATGLLGKGSKILLKFSVYECKELGFIIILIYCFKTLEFENINLAAVVEKLLRSTSVDKIYLLIKAKDKEAALDRLQREVQNHKHLYVIDIPFVI